MARAYVLTLTAEMPLSRGSAIRFVQSPFAGTHHSQSSGKGLPCLQVLPFADEWFVKVSRHRDRRRSVWWALAGSNRGPSACKADALTG
jgi:hypothetical protein